MTPFLKYFISENAKNALKIFYVHHFCKIFGILMNLENYRRRSSGRIFEVSVESTGRWSIDRGRFDHSQPYAGMNWRLGAIFKNLKMAKPYFSIEKTYLSIEVFSISTLIDFRTQ